MQETAKYSFEDGVQHCQNHLENAFSLVIELLYSKSLISNKKVLGKEILS